MNRDSNGRFGSTKSNELKVGDVVRLKSGGPAMVIHLLKGEIARVVWFTDEYCDMHSDEVNMACLEKASKTPRILQ